MGNSINPVIGSSSTSSGVSEQEVRDELDRVLASELFLKSPQLSRFLRFCVEETLSGQQDCLKEQVLGTDVFRRAAPFDPRLDPIVRVEARRLRSKLDQYYAGEGASNPVLLSFQRGDYVPRFIRTSLSHCPAPASRSARIVIVDDERMMARDLEQRLKNSGYHVVGVAATGETALQQVEELRPDVVLMDIVLAGAMRGTEVARRIWKGWRIPVVYLTSFSDAMVLEDVMRSEPYGFVLKPFDFKQLHAVLQLAISRRDRESADASVHSELSREEGVLSALLQARIRPWDWIVRDASLPWPASVEVPSPDVGMFIDNSPSRFLEKILPADRDRVQHAFTDAIRRESQLEINYRRGPGSAGIEWILATGTVMATEAGRLRCSGFEIGPASAPRPASASNVGELEQFVRAAGHDLQEPLRTVKSYTQMLARQRREGEPASETVLNFIEGGVDRMQSLVSNLLTYTGLAEECPRAFEPVYVEEAVDAALQNLRAAIVDSGARISRSELPQVIVGRQHFIQLFQNLISNSIKYRRPDTLPEITVEATAFPAHWRITVRDNGKGFDPADSDRIFRAFHRLDSNSTPGSGLGLAICRRIVDTYGGRIWAESTPGEGSAFHFTLPGACPAESSIPSVSTAVPNQQSPR